VAAYHRAREPALEQLTDWWDTGSQLAPCEPAIVLEPTDHETWVDAYFPRRKMSRQVPFAAPASRSPGRIHFTAVAFAPRWCSAKGPRTDTWRSSRGIVPGQSLAATQT